MREGFLIGRFLLKFFYFQKIIFMGHGLRDINPRHHHRCPMCGTFLLILILNDFNFALRIDTEDLVIKSMVFNKNKHSRSWVNDSNFKLDGREKEKGKLLNN